MGGRRSGLPVCSWLGLSLRMRALMAQFFRKLPPAASAAAAALLAARAAQIVSPASAEDVAQPIVYAAAAHPAVLTDALLTPLLRRLNEDAHGLESEGASLPGPTSGALGATAL